MDTQAKLSKKELHVKLVKRLHDTIRLRGPTYSYFTKFDAENA